MNDEEERTARGKVDGTRRRLLARLGLGAAVAYAAPVLLELSRARASGSGSFSGGRPAPRAQAPAPPPPPEIVVAAQDATVIDAIAALGYGLLSRAPLGLIDAEIARFSLPGGITVEQARQQIIDLAPDALFDLNHIYRPGELTCGEEGCMAFEMIGWTSAAHACPSGTTVGMVDTTVNADHAALQGVDLELLRIIAEGREPASAIHGTAIAILIAGRADSRTPGLLDGVRLVAAQAFHKDRTGQDAADIFDIARAISELAERGVGVVNLSFTGPDNAVLRRVVEAANDQGTLLVAAAGNAGPGSEPLYPAAYEQVVAVTAVDRERDVFRQANAGEHIDFAAPGVLLWTAASVSGGRLRSGTSYAAPFVSAALAVAQARWPEEDGDALVSRLSENAIDLGEAGRDATYGWGLVQAPESCGAPMLPASGGG